MVSSANRVLISPFPTGKTFEYAKSMAPEYSKVKRCGSGRDTDAIIIAVDSTTLALAVVDMFNGRKEKLVRYSARLCSDDELAEWKIVYTLQSKTGAAAGARPLVVGLGRGKKVTFV